MSDTGKEENNDNPLKISEILADFFLKKIDMPYASDDSEHLHKSKRKKSKHKKRKHKKNKHRHRSSSSDSRTELNIKVFFSFSFFNELLNGLSAKYDKHDSVLLMHQRINKFSFVLKYSKIVIL